jgi:hypothetical protein
MQNTSYLKVGDLCVGLNNSMFASHSQLMLQACDNNPSQFWKAGQSPDNNYTQALAAFPPTAQQLCWDIANSSTSDGASVMLFACTTDNTQQWAVDDMGRLRPGHAPTKCLDTSTGTVSTTWLVITTCNQADSQKLLAVAAGEYSCSPLLAYPNSCTCQPAVLQRN